MKKKQTPIGSCVISSSESLEFAYASGDFNPLHLDPVIARRYQFGSTLVHGIHATLLSLNQFFASQPTPAILSSLTVLFSKPLQQDAEMQIFYERLTGSTVKIEVYSQGKRVQAIEFDYLPLKQHDSDLQTTLIQEGSAKLRPSELSIEESGSLSGNVPLVWNSVLFTRLFPQLEELLPRSQCATILATTNIVGMICPGLNSVFASLALKFNPSNDRLISGLEYTVDNTDARFARVLMRVINDVATGEIEAYFRPRPAKQASFCEIQSYVKDNQFAGQHALVVGGSRGIGEVTAKLLAAGGARVTITYATGREDALSVTQEITNDGAVCECKKFDIREEQVTDIFERGINKITHIYYMASPLIEKNTSNLWNGALFDTYVKFYVHGLADLIAPITLDPEYRGTEFSIFFPSTAFLQHSEKGFAEYAAAKAAAEEFAVQMSGKYPKWRFHIPRLPRMFTDQTSGLAGLDPLDSVRQMLKCLIGQEV